MKSILTKAETDALLQEALTRAGGNMELVARTALQELVGQMVLVKLLEEKIGDVPVKRSRGRPPKPGLSVPKGYKTLKPLGAPNKMGLSISTKRCGEIAERIQKYGVTVSDRPITEVKPQSDKEAAKRTLQVLDPGWILEDSVKQEEKIANVAKRISEVRSRKA